MSSGKIARAASVAALAVVVVSALAFHSSLFVHRHCGPGLRLAAAGDPDGSGCVPLQHPESMREMAAMQQSRLAPVAAPFGEVPPGAYRAAFEHKQKMAALKAIVPGAGG